MMPRKIPEKCVEASVHCSDQTGIAAKMKIIGEVT
jgi:hypothetical protein